MCPDYNIDSDHAQVIQRNYLLLSARMDACNSGLLGELFARDVIDRRDKDDLAAELSSTRRNEELLSMLGRKSKQQFDHFLEALKKTGQSHVVSNLERPSSSSQGNEIVVSILNAHD